MSDQVYQCPNCKKPAISSNNTKIQCICGIAYSVKGNEATILEFHRDGKFTFLNERIYSFIGICKGCTTQKIIVCNDYHCTTCCLKQLNTCWLCGEELKTVYKIDCSTQMVCKNGCVSDGFHMEYDTREVVGFKNGKKIARRTSDM